MIEIKILPHEAIEILRYAEAINKNKRDKKVKDKKIAKYIDSTKLDAIGLGGEFAVCKYFGIDYKIELYTIRDKCDIEYKNKKIECKVSKIKDVYLKIPEWQINKDIDYYFLLKSDGNLFTYFLMGWISKKEFLSIKEKITFKGYEKYPMWCVHESYLHKFKQDNIIVQ